MSHNFPCSPQGGKISPLNPNRCTGKTILGSINVAVNHLITGHSRMGKLHCSIVPSNEHSIWKFTSVVSLK